MTNRVNFIPDILSGKTLHFESQVGKDVLSCVKICLDKGGYSLSVMDVLEVYINGEYLDRFDWEKCILCHGQSISIFVSVHGGGGGGKNPLGMILTAVVMLAATVVTYGAAGYAAGTAWGAGSIAMAGSSLSIAGAAFAVGSGLAVSIGGLALIGSVFKPSQPKIANSQAEITEKVWSITGTRNALRLYDVIPLPLGKVRYAPVFLAKPYSFLRGNDQYARYLLGVLGNNKVSDLRIGATSVDKIAGIKYNIFENWTGQDLTIFTGSVDQENVGIPLKYTSGYVQRTTAKKTKEAVLDITFPRGLVSYDNKMNRNSSSVTFSVYYAPKDSDQWIGAAFYAKTTGGTMSPGPFPTERPRPYPHDWKNGRIITITKTKIIYIDAGGNLSENGGTPIAHLNSNVLYECYVRMWETEKGMRRDYTHKIIGTSYSVQALHQSSVNMRIVNNVAIIDPGEITSSLITFSAATAQLQRRSIFIKFLQPGQYDIKIARLTADSDPNNVTEPVFNDSELSTVSYFKDEKPIIYNGCPHTLIEVEIKAGEQIQGNIEEFNAVFHSVCPVWDGKNWIEAPSNNPASIALMTATTPVIALPVKLDRFILDDLVLFYEWCEKYGWHYNSVQTSETVGGILWDNVLSAARGIRNLIGTKISVAWDDPDKLAVFPFGSRNVSGLVIKKQMGNKPIHALRCRFLDEDSDFIEAERIVYNDGYNEENAVNIADFEKDGCTRADTIYKHARLQMAEAIHRDIACEFQTDFSFLNVHNFDRIKCNHYVAMWGVSQFRVVDLVFAKDSFGNDTDYVTHFKIDDMVTGRKNKSYSAIWHKYYGVDKSFGIVFDDDTTTDILKLEIPAHKDDCPNSYNQSDLCSFGLSGKETKDLIIVNMQPEGMRSAKLTCHMAAPEIYKALDGPIPPYDSGITIPDRWLIDTPYAPLAVDFQTDEFVLEQRGGYLQPRIKINFTLAQKKDVVVSKIVASIVEKNTGNRPDIQTFDYFNNNTIFIDNVEDEKTYIITLFSLSDRGKYSEPSPPYEVFVVGRSTPPPAPIFVHIDGTLVWWEMPEDYPIDVVGWEVLIGMDDTDPVEYAKSITSPYVPVKEIDIAQYSGQARRIFIRTVDDYGLKSDAVSVVINLGDVQSENIVNSYFESQRKWPGKIENGRLYNDDIIGIGLTHMMSPDVHALDPEVPVMGDVQGQIVYTTLFIPSIIDIPCFLTVKPILKSGGIASVEYGIVESGVHMMSPTVHMMSPTTPVIPIDPIYWRPMPDRLPLSNQYSFFIRVKSSNNISTIIDDIEYIFDVEDENSTIKDLDIPSSGIRVPIGEKQFRLIKNITFGLEYSGGDAETVVFLDKGIVQDNYVIEGPLVKCLDKNGNDTSGRADIFLQGIKGV